MLSSLITSNSQTTLMDIRETTHLNLVDIKQMEVDLLPHTAQVSRQQILVVMIINTATMVWIIKEVDIMIILKTRTIRDTGTTWKAQITKNIAITTRATTSTLWISKWMQLMTVIGLDQLRRVQEINMEILMIGIIPSPINMMLTLTRISIETKLSI